MSNITNINVKLCKSCSVSRNGDSGTVIQGCKAISDCPYLSVKVKFEKIIEAFKAGTGHKPENNIRHLAIV